MGRTLPQSLPGLGGGRWGRGSTALQHTLISDIWPPELGEKGSLLMPAPSLRRYSSLRPQLVGGAFQA